MQSLSMRMVFHVLRPSAKCTFFIQLPNNGTMNNKSHVIVAYIYGQTMKKHRNTSQCQHPRTTSSPTCATYSETYITRRLNAQIVNGSATKTKCIRARHVTASYARNVKISPRSAHSVTNAMDLIAFLMYITLTKNNKKNYATFNLFCPDNGAMHETRGYFRMRKGGCIKCSLKRKKRTRD